MTQDDDEGADEVVFSAELSTPSGHRVAVASLNAPGAMNALSLEMVRELSRMLRHWAKDDGVFAVVLQGVGEKAFCAGGDVRALVRSLCSGEARPSEYARAFFEEEYQLDYLIHTYEKPILCWGHGVVMGGGIGLMVGASHRVVTPQSRLAMPEISIGMYPDVGGSWFLRRMPGRVGLFLALTGVAINAADALFCGLADYALSVESRPQVTAAMRAARWSDSVAENRAALSRILAAHTTRDLQESNVRRHFDRIGELMAGEDLGDIAARLRELQRSEDPWLAKAAVTFAKGSPTSAAVSFELWRRARHMSLAEVLRLEYVASLGCCAHPDFVEGVRALLIEKDKKPRWQPASIEEVPRALVEEILRPRFEGAHPLAALGQPEL